MSVQSKNKAQNSDHPITSVVPPTHPPMDLPVVCLPDHHGGLDSDWLEQLKTQVPADQLYTLPRLADQYRLKPLKDPMGPASTWPQTLARSFTGPVFVITSGLRIPPHLNQRLNALPIDPWALIGFGGNHCPQLDPAFGIDRSLPVEHIDALVWNLSEAAIAPLSSNEASLIHVALVNPKKSNASTDEESVRLGFCDALYFQSNQPQLANLGSATRCSESLLGGLQQRLVAFLQEGHQALPYIGLDGLPVTLHISHSWGGGIARWIDDLYRNDSTSHHLVLRSYHDSDRTAMGQHLELMAAGPSHGLIHQYRLDVPITDTAISHPEYERFLTWIIKRFGVGRIVVSSLIGHALECLTQDCPTVQMLHDFYPASPVLDVDPLLYCDDQQGLDLRALIQDHRRHFKFANTSAQHWADLRTQWQQRITTHKVVLIAPSQHVIERWQTLFAHHLPTIALIPHGFDCPKDWPTIAPAKVHEKAPLQLVVVGRLSSGKGLARLLEVAQYFKDRIHFTAIGTGQEGMTLFGLSNVDVILDYNQQSLPSVIGNAEPHGALFLSRVPETWNYVLSELRCLGLPVIAPAHGSFEERITDGQTGKLYAPDTQGLIECLESVLEDPTKLMSLRSAPEEPALADAIKAYNKRCGAKTRPPEWLTSPSPSRSTLNAQAATIGQLSHALSDRVADNEALHEKIKTQAQWLDRLDRTVKARSQWALNLEKELTGQLAVLQQSRDSLQSQYDSVKHHHDLLDAQLTEILNSRSWRLTRPLRATVRMLTALHQRRAWHPANWARQSKRLIHAIRVHGWRTTFDALQYHRPASAIGRGTVPSADHPIENKKLVPVNLTHTESDAQSTMASIIVPVHNKVHYTAHCLESLAKHLPACRYEVIVVNDASSDDTADFLAQCQGLTVISNEDNLGFIGSCNKGAAAARGQYLVFLNNDTEVTEGWLDALIQTFDQWSDVGVVGGRLVYPDGQLQEAGGIIFKDGSGWNYGRLGPADASRVTFVSEADYVSGACLAIPKALFDDLGGFDTHFSPAYYEDTDLCFKVRAGGKKVIYQPRSTIIHFEGISSGTCESSGIKRYQAINRDKFKARWADTLATHPEPVPGPQALELIERARHHRSRGHVLVIDAVTPQPDHDSGSMRMVSLLEILLSMGYRVSFMPINLAWDGPYAQALQDMGVEVLALPEVHSPKQWLEHHGRLVDWVIASRYYVLDDVVADIKVHCPSAKILFDTVDLHFLREQRKAELDQDPALARTAKQTEAKELALMEQSHTTLVVSEVEKKLLEEISPNIQVEILSNIHTPIENVVPFEKRRGIFFVGGYQHPPNVDAANWLINEILPALRNQAPEIELHLIGSRMPEWLQNTRAPGLRNHGFVEDIAPYLQQCRVALAPLRYGAGVKGKVNQAMAWGVPVVATACAAEGMHTRHDHDILIAETTDQFVSEILRIYHDPALWQRLSINGQNNVERFFSKHTAGQTLAKILADAPG